MVVTVVPVAVDPGRAGLAGAGLAPPPGELITNCCSSVVLAKLFIRFRQKYFYIIPCGVLLLLLLLDQLLGGLEVLQGDALRGPPRLSHSLGVGFPLDLVLFITNRRYKRSKYLKHVKTFHINIMIWKKSRNIQRIKSNYKNIIIQQVYYKRQSIKTL